MKNQGPAPKLAHWVLVLKPPPPGLWCHLVAIVVTTCICIQDSSGPLLLEDSGSGLVEPNCFCSGFFLN